MKLELDPQADALYLRLNDSKIVESEQVAEIYSLAAADEDMREWRLEEQQKLSRVARWRDDYFQYWAEALAFGEAGRGWLTTPAAWVIVVFDAKGEPVCCVEYRPLFADGVVDDVGYSEAAWRLAPSCRD